MVEFISLSSGSNGNCYYIGNEEWAILIDAGIGPRTIKKRLAENGLSFDKVELVLVTHNHIDHVKALPSLAERCHIPLYVTPRLYKGLLNFRMVGPCIKDYAVQVEAGVEHTYKSMTFVPFVVPHDAVETLGYHICMDGVRFTFVTDTGAVTPELIEYGTRSQVLIVEANYDSEMLAKGPYTAELKARISNGYGHLSNRECADAVKRILERSKLSHIFLCHLSENNNTPDAALAAVKSAVSDGLCRSNENTSGCANEEPLVMALPRRTPSGIFRF